MRLLSMSEAHWLRAMCRLGCVWERMCMASPVVFVLVLLKRYRRGYLARR